MGIKKLYKIIEKYAPKAIISATIDDFIGKRIAIDANLMIYKSVTAVKVGNYDIVNYMGKNKVSVTHLHTLFIKLLAFMKYNIKATFVFDGVPPDIKLDTIEIRKKMSKIKYLTSKNWHECRQLIEIMGFPIIESPQEADSQCAQLYIEKKVDAIISDDLDILLFGGGILVKNFSVSSKKKFNIIDLDLVLKYLNLTQNQLVDLGILLGSDYYIGKSMGPEKGLKYIHEYKTIEKIIKHNEHLKHNKKKIKIVKKYFKSPIVIKKNSNITIKKINYEKLEQFLLAFGFSKTDYIDKYIDKIKLSSQQ